MSFILDAVKKSEQERRYAQSESLQSWYYQPVKQKPKSSFWIVSLLLLNSLVLVALFLWVMKPAWLVGLVDQLSSQPSAQVVSPAPLCVDADILLILV